MTISRRRFIGNVGALGAASMLAPLERSAASDFANESLVVDGLDVSPLNDEYLSLMREGGVDCVHSSTGVSASRMGGVYRFVDSNPNDVTIAKSASDIRNAKADGKIAIIFGAQHANYLESPMTKSVADFYEPIFSLLRAHYSLGLRTQGICYNVSNVFGGGNLDDSVPLTRAGRRLVEEIHRLRIVLDVGGHTGEQTSFDAIAVSGDIPVVCTHTNMEGLVPNIRATSDELCEAIAKTGGVIGITAISDFQMRSIENYKQHGPRSPQSTLENHLDQYDYLKNLVGIDHIGLGPDFIWGWRGGLNHKGHDNVVFPTESLSDGQPQVVKDFENISKLDNLINGLKERGWSDRDLEKLLGDNWMRVYEQVWGS